MLVSQLYDNNKQYSKLTAFIIGTGPSLRLYPKEFFNDPLGITIGLNYAYKYIKCDLNITIHPEVIPKDWYEQEQGWVVKKGKLPKPTKPHDFMYWFNSNDDLIFDYTNLTSEDDSLYVGRGILTGALCLAAKMGFKTAILVGCDMCSLGKDHHFNEQHVQMHSLPAEEVYREYYANAAMVRDKLKKAYGMETLSMSPFLGLGYHERDYSRLCEEAALPSIPIPKDVSKYAREKVDFS